MKCDELFVYCKTTCDPQGLYYSKPEVDEAIAELKVRNVMFHDEAKYYKAENESLKSKLESVQASAYADSVDAEMRERRLRRALFIAHAIKAKFKWWWMSECKHNESCKLFPDTRKIKKFTKTAWVCSKSQEKCRAKAEEYK